MSIEFFTRLADELEVEESATLAARRADARRRFESLGLPSRRDEAYRFTPVADIAKTQWRRGDGVTRIGREIIEDHDIADSHRLIFVDGKYQHRPSRIRELPSGAFVGSLADAQATISEVVETHLGQHIGDDEHALAAMMAALADDGAVVYVPKGQRIEQPIHLLFLSTGRGQASFVRLLVIAEENAECEIVERYQSVGDDSESSEALTCSLTEVVVGAGAHVEHAKLQRESESVSHMSFQRSVIERDGNFNSHAITIGGKLVRNDIRGRLVGPGAHATLNGLYLVQGSQHVDTNMVVEHAAPNCTSHELYKGILEQSARSVFNGLILVAKGAQQTDAIQNNKNLLLSPNALARSNPQLEIYADDVRCTHGSTIGQLDDEAVFYLRSRGLSREAAESLLTFAFAADVIARLKITAVREELETFLFSRLPAGEVVRQAI